MAVDILLPAAINGQTPYTYTLAGLPAGLIFTEATRRITGSVATAGTWPLTYTVSDLDSVEDSSTFTVRALGPPGVPTSVSLTTVDYDTLRLAWSPPGSGDPATSYQGQYREGTSGPWTDIAGNITSAHDIDGLSADTMYQAQVRATNSAGSSAYSSPEGATTTAMDAPLTAPAIGDQTATVGVAFSFSLPSATGGDGLVTTSADQLPAGLTLTGGVISGTPTTAGTTTVTITYTDADGDMDSADFDIVVVVADPTVPTAPAIADQTATVGTAFSFTLPSAIGGDAPVTTSADQLPAGLTLTAGVISGTPTTAGTTTVTITYTDADGDMDSSRIRHRCQRGGDNAGLDGGRGRDPAGAGGVD